MPQAPSAAVSSSPWPAHLDAIIAAPAHHRLLLENERVRVLETRIEPGETVPLHTHQWPAVFSIQSQGHLIRRDERGEVTFDSRTAARAAGAGEAVWSPALAPHTLENVGTSLIHVISVEVKPGA
jgi:quercetin dioxygenase-like cupin family protein